MSETLLHDMQKAFLDSAILTFRKMIMVELVPCEEIEALPQPWEFSGIIGFSGEIAGNCALRMSAATAREAITRLTGESVEDYAELSDGVGELVNMISGNAKAALDKYSISLSFPDVIRGAGHEISFHRHSDTFSLYFTSEIGTVAVVTAFSDFRTRKAG
jgi:chemotaxis protein CheX